MITGVILTHNEEHHVVDCIAALRPHVAELFLIDTESTDQTVALARPLVDRVLSHPNIPNFDAVRNIAIPEAQFDWLWFVDADERIPDRTGQIVNDLIRTRGHEFEAINIPFKSHFCGQWMQHCGWWPGYTVCRVLKRGHFEFGRVLHSGVTLRGREMRFPPDPELAVPHYSFRDLEHYVAKFNRYTTTEALQLKDRDFKYDWRFAVHMMMHDLWEHYELNQAKLDGSLGWILTWMAGQYRWMSLTKLIDLQPRDPAPSVPANLDEFLLVMEQELAAFRTRRPLLPLGIVLRRSLPLSEELPEFVALARALAESEREVALEVSAPNLLVDCQAVDRALLRSLCRARRPRSAVGIVCDAPPNATPSRLDAVNILWTPWSQDSKNIPVEWIERAKQFDEVWVNSVAEQTALREQWLAPERMRVFNLETPNSASLSQNIDQAIADLEGRLQPPVAAEAIESQIRVEFEGELFAGHSFSNVNEQVLPELNNDPAIAVAVRRVFHNPTTDRSAFRAGALLSLANRKLPSPPAITIRHAFPPNWTRPDSGLWVHIQPWEYGALPADWLPHLRDKVDEVWAPSNYVKRVYVQSGVSRHKIHVIPWGIDETTFNPTAPPLILPTQKTFRFLFVGGTIPRKGFDRLLEAYLKEFRRGDDVCLVIKDSGVRSFYANANFREQVLAAIQDANNPEIIYIDEDFTAGQLASLYCSCQCLVAPYRGEGFGLPILEAMACGLAPIVPRGGPTDDFVSADTAYLLDAREVQNGIEGLCGPGTELEISIDELRRTLRDAMADQDRTRALGRRGSSSVRGRLTWAKTARLMASRIRILANFRQVETSPALWSRSDSGHLAAIVEPTGDDRQLADCLCRLQPFVGRMFVIDRGMTPTAKTIAQEYGASLLTGRHDGFSSEFSSGWVIRLAANESIREPELMRLQQLTFSLPPTMDGVQVGVRTQEGIIDWRETRVFRLRQDMVEFGPESGSLGTEIAAIATDNFIDCLEAAPATPAEFTSPVGAPHNGPINGVLTPPHRPIKKGVLIQLATGLHQELLDITRAHHRAYAARHGLDYWCVEGNPAAPKRAGWGKIPLIRSAMQMGFEHILWIDADAIIVNPEVDLTNVITAGIGMVQHPNPTHWNSGVMLICGSEQARRFFEAVDAEPENDSGWMEQLPINQLAERPDFAGLFTSLSPRFNSTPGAVFVPEPIILAAHGLPLSARLELLTNWLRGAQAGTSIADSGLDVFSREDFGEFLNRRGLLGEAAEIGVLRGEFSRVLLDRWNGKTLHLVDPWRHLEGYKDISNLTDSDHEACLIALKKSLDKHHGRYRLHRKLSKEAVSSFADESLDFVYIDANHEFSAVLQDIRAWFQKVRPGGVLAGHDYLDGRLPEGDFGVKSAVGQFELESNTRAQATLELRWPSWYIIKPSLPYLQAEMQRCVAS